MKPRVLGVIPARSGSKGLANKNILPMAGMPLLVHTLKCASLCSSLTRLVVSTDGEAIADVARQYGGDVPFLRPAELAGDDVPMWPVLQHALAFVESEEGQSYDILVLLDPTSPTRMPDDVERVITAVLERPDADLALTVSEPHFSPFWHMLVQDSEGFGKPLMPDARKIIRRQECPTTYFINGLAYAFRASFLRVAPSWAEGRFLMVDTPATRATSIDNAEEFRWTEALIEKGLLSLPWMREVTHG